MENLIRPEFGISFWTILIFFILVLVLSKFLWRPLLRQLDEREARIKKDIEDARALKEEAERYKTELERRLSEINKEAEQILKRVKDEAELEREKILEKAQTQAELIIENARKEIEEMKKETEKELHRKVVEISVAVSKKVLSDIVDKKIEEKLLETTIKEHKNYLKD